MSIYSKIAMIIAIAASPLATVQAADDSQSIRIRTADLNLATASGQKTLALRIDRAARELCDTADDRYGPQVLKAKRLCRKEVKAVALAAVKTRTPEKMANR